MRAKRSKKYRKIMQQYELTFGFREPYQVLVDSHFLLAIKAFSMPLIPSLERTLHGKVKPFITKCSLAAVNERHAVMKPIASESTSKPNTTSRPPRRPMFLPPPTELPLRHCDHGDRGILDESECLLELSSGGLGATVLSGESIGQGKQPKNREHYIIATADAEAGEKIAPVQTTGRKRKRGFGEDLDVRSLIREVPGVPIIYVKRSVMILEELSGASLGVRRKEEKEKMAEGIPTGKRKLPSIDDDDEEDDQMGIKKRRVSTKAKGPNPLSVKKKKTKAPTQVNGVHKSNETAATAVKSSNTETDQESDKPKAKRRRKHSKKSSSTAEPSAISEGTEGITAVE